MGGGMEIGIGLFLHVGADVVPLLGHFLFGQINAVRLFVHDDLPFFSTASSADGSLTVAIAAGKSSPPCMTDSYARILSAIKKLLPQIVLGQELSLLRYHPNSPAEGGRAHFCAQTMRTPLITGGVPVAPSLIQVRIALVSPFSRFSAAAIPPSAALFVRQAPAYYSYSSVSAFFLLYATSFTLSTIILTTAAARRPRSSLPRSR